MKDKFNLQLSPAITQRLELWRFITGNFVYVLPGEMVFGTLLLYLFRQFERRMGSAKYSVRPQQPNRVGERERIPPVAGICDAVLYDLYHASSWSAVDGFLDAASNDDGTVRASLMAVAEGSALRPVVPLVPVIPILHIVFLAPLAPLALQPYGPTAYG